MTNNLIETKLEELGFSPEEISIYLYLIKNEEQSLLELSRGLKIDRAKVYRNIEKMLQKQLVEETLSSRGKKVKASPPETLQVLINLEEEKVNHKKQILPEITQLLHSLSPNSQNTFKIKTYKGQDGMGEMMKNQLNAKKDILTMAFTTSENLVGKEFAKKIKLEIIEKKIKIYCLYNDEKNLELADTTQSIFIPEHKLKIRQQVYIYNDVFAIINKENDEFVGLEITDKTLAEMQRQAFWGYFDQVNI